MATKQNYGIKYPFTSENDEGVYLDVNEKYSDMVRSKLLHILFTPKGQRYMDPNFGTDLIKYIFSPKDGSTMSELKDSIRTDVTRYLHNVQFDDVSIYDDEKSVNGIVVVIYYSIIKGNIKESTSVAVKL